MQKSVIHFFESLSTTKIVTFLVLLGLIIFANTLFNQFVWDDHAYIESDNAIQSFDLSALFSQNPFNSPQYYYRPISAIYFSLIYLFFGTEVFFYHFSQIALQICNTILLFFLFRRFLTKHLALFLSTIFLVHPINTESIDFIAAAVGPLSMFYGLCALVLATKKRLTKLYLFLITILLILSIFSKETGLLFIPLIVLYRFFFMQKKDIRKLSMLGFLVALSYPLLRFSFIGESMQAYTNLPLAKASLLVKILNIPAMFFYYLKIFFFPYQIVIDQLWIVTKLTVTDFYLPLGIVILFFLAIILFGIYLYHKNSPLFKTFLFFFIWLILGFVLLLPLSSLDMTVADRWFYFPMVGLLGIIGLLIHEFFLTLLQKKQSYIFLAVIFGIMLILILSIRTVIRNMDWHSDLSLHTVQEKLGTNFDIELNLGEEYIQLGKYAEGIDHLQQSIAIYPADLAYYNLGYAYVQTRQMNKAENSYINALSATPYSYTKKHPLEMYGIVGVLLSKTNPQQAVTYTLQGLHIYPNSALLWLIYAVATNNAHDTKDALLGIQNSLNISPSQQAVNIQYDIQHHLPTHLDPSYSPIE